MLLSFSVRCPRLGLPPGPATKPNVAFVPGPPTPSIQPPPLTQFSPGDQPAAQSILDSALARATSAIGCKVIVSCVITCSALTMSSPDVAPTVGTCSLMITLPFGNATVWLAAPVTVID